MKTREQRRTKAERESRYRNLKLQKQARRLRRNVLTRLCHGWRLRRGWSEADVLLDALEKFS